jgi:hypothetical protein
VSANGQETNSVGDERKPRGWRSQSPVLKALLFVSLACVAIGVYRCSVELVPADGPRVILVERATIAVPDTLVAVPPDSVAALATRLFARSLRDLSTVDVTTAESAAAWAVVRLHVGEADGGIELVGTASSALSGRRLSAVAARGAPARLREVAAEAALGMWSDLEAAADSGVETQ